MKYTKNLLNRDTRDYNDELFYGALIEMLNNEKTLEEFVDKIVSYLHKSLGRIHIFRLKNNHIEMLTNETENLKEKVLESEVFKKIRETKKAYFLNNAKEAGGYYAGFPLNFKGKMIGGLIIEEKKSIKHWKELYMVLNLLVLALRFYALLEKERNMNIKDIITGLYNEKYFYHHLEAEESKYRRFKTPMTLVLVDFANFNKINDTYGYEIGEKVLQYVADTIKKQSRLYDMPARLERGLFAILLSQTDKQGGEAVSSRIKKTIGDVVEINGNEIGMDIRVAYSEFSRNHTRESFLSEVMEKLK